MCWTCPAPNRKTFDDSLPDAVQVADPFHVVRHANSKFDECRRRVQNETLGHRGRKADPLYRSRRLLTSGYERLASNGETRLLSLLEAGDPHGEVRMTWHAKETVRRLYDIDRRRRQGGPRRPRAADLGGRALSSGQLPLPDGVGQVRHSWGGLSADRL